MRHLKYIVLVLAVLLVAAGCTFTTGDNQLGYGNQFGDYAVVKNVTNTSITTATPYDITNPVTGSLKLEKLVIQTDSTSPFNCGQLLITKTGSSYGTTTVMTVPQAVVATSTTVNLGDSGVTYSRYPVLENGEKLQISAIGANCAGGGTMKIWSFFKRTSTGASIYE